MLENTDYLFTMNDEDRSIFEMLLPEEDVLIDAEKMIDWKAFDSLLAKFYSTDRGRIGLPPSLFVKLLYLQYHCNLGDLAVMKRADTDILLRWFLQIPLRFRLPDESLLSKFRKRIGSQGCKEVFDQLITQARQAGLVKDRLRLKDASHILANIAVPTTLGLLAQLQVRLLREFGVFAKESAAALRETMDLMRLETKDQSDEARLQARVEVLKSILEHVASFPQPEDAASNQAWQALQKTVSVVQKVLADGNNPKATRRIRSGVDDEARRGKHGDFYDGFMIDVMMDADSELVTELNVLEAGGDEAISALEMVRREHATHGNQVGEFSIDGAGFNGPMLRGMAEMDVEVTVPPRSESVTALFTPEKFEVVEDGSAVRCPAGKVSSYKTQEKDKHSTTFRFKQESCVDCVLLALCMKALGSGPFGRNVTKNDYTLEYDRARAKATTTDYQQVRRQHPAIERKLNEIVNHHGCRRARYRGRAKTLFQACFTVFAVNTKRMTKLLRAQSLKMAC